MSVAYKHIQIVPKPTDFRAQIEESLQETISDEEGIIITSSLIASVRPSVDKIDSILRDKD